MTIMDTMMILIGGAVLQIVGQRLCALRISMKLPRVQMAEYIGMVQSSINRYEAGESEAPFEILLKYSDYFDVSLDYIFGRTDNPQGKLYANHPRLKRLRRRWKSL